MAPIKCPKCGRESNDTFCYYCGEVFNNTNKLIDMRKVRKFYLNFAYIINRILFPPAKIVFVLWTLCWIIGMPADNESSFGQKVYIVLFGYLILCGIADLIYYKNQAKYIKYKMKITQKKVKRLRSLMYDIDPIRYEIDYGNDDIVKKKSLIAKIFHKGPSALEKAQSKLQRANQLADIINTTYNFEEFLKSFDELIRTMEFLQMIENASFFTGAKPSEDLAEINKKRPLTEKEFIDRFFYRYGKDGLMENRGYFHKFSPEATKYANSILGGDFFSSSNQNVILNNNFDFMEGHDFEYFCADVLRKNGFTNVEVTQGSGDHGIDVLAEKDGITYAVQCKCYSSNIGNAAVQQAHTGKSLYHKDIAVVMTNRYFTPQAVEEAEALGVKLWDRDRLSEMIGNQ